MKHIIIILLILSLPAMALESGVSQETTHTGNPFQQKMQQDIKKKDQNEVPLLQKIQKNTPKGCNPEQALKLPTLN
jgi:hypothetical protein